jgi:hypothetical protein
MQSSETCRGRPTVKLHCPTCNKPVDIGNASRFELFTCACRRKFRGIHADECLADYLFWKFAGVPVRLLTFGLAGRIDRNKLNYTSCPFCDAEISITYTGQYKGVEGPSHCWACTRKLPDDPVNNLKPPAATTIPAPSVTSTDPPVLTPTDPDAVAKAKAHIDNAERLSEKGKWGPAIAEYTAAIRLDPSSWLAYLKRGEAQQMVDDHAKAIADLTRAIELNVGCAEAYRERACVYLIEDDFQRAIADSIPAYLDADRMQEAIPDLERGTRLPSPDYDETVQDARDRLAKARRRAKGR